MAASRISSVPALTPIALLHPPGDPEHSVSFARRTYEPLGWPVDRRGRAVRGSISQAAEMHPPGWRWRPLFNVHASDLHEVFPQILEQLLEDSVFSVCGMFVPRQVESPADAALGRPKELGSYRASNTTVEVGGQRLRLPRAHRRGDSARGITAAWVDLDFYKLGLSEEDVVGALHGMQRRGEIPPVSMFLFSGRGLWAFWVLRDHDDHQKAVRAGASNVRRWERVQRALHARLAHLGSDAAALDVARTARVPGSLRTDLGDGEPVVVGWQVQGPPDRAAAFTYTLDELEKLVGVEGDERAERVAAALDAPPAARLRGQRGARGRFFKLLQQLDALEQMRGGWSVGTRGRAMWLQVGAMVSVRKSCRRLDDLDRQPVAMRRIGQLNNHDILRHALEIAERCERGADFDPRSEARAVWRRAVKEGGLGNRRTGGKTVSHRTVSEWLAVTPEESEQLREIGFENPLPPARRFRHGPELPAPAHLDRASVARARRDCIASLEAERVTAGSPWPTLRGLAELLAARGQGATPRTIMKDLAVLGIANPYCREVLRLERARREAVGALPFGAA